MSVFISFSLDTGIIIVVVVKVVFTVTVIAACYCRFPRGLAGRGCGSRLCLTTTAASSSDCSSWRGCLGRPRAWQGTTVVIGVFTCAIKAPSGRCQPLQPGRLTFCTLLLVLRVQQAPQDGLAGSNCTAPPHTGNSAADTGTYRGTRLTQVVIRMTNCLLCATIAARRAGGRGSMRNHAKQAQCHTRTNAAGTSAVCTSETCSATTQATIRHVLFQRAGLPTSDTP